MMGNKVSAKIIILCVLGVLSFLGVSGFAADPSFSLTPGSGTQLKLHCMYNFGVVINPGGYSFNGFDSTVKFDSGNTNIVHQSIDPFFTSTTNGYISNGFLYRAYGVRPGGSGSSTLTATNFLFYTTQNILSTFLEFTTYTGGTIVFDTNTTDDGAVINSSISSHDLLTGITNAGYTFVALPCIMDAAAPSIMNTDPADNARYVASGHVVSFVLYDREGPGIAPGIPPMTDTNDKSHYRYSGLNAVLANYQPAPSSVDNQEGVDSGSVQVYISCPACASPWAYTLSGASLNMSARGGISSINRYTRDSEARGYTISFACPAPSGYEVEKEVIIVITGADNPNELGNTHTGTFTLSFNSPQPPDITMTSPLDGATFVDNKISPISFTFTDDRAGIDTGSISITIPAIYSGGDLLYTGKTYSGSDLTVTLISGSPGLGNAGSYAVSFVPQRYFPYATGIFITGYVEDLAGNISTGNRRFSTRPSCASLGCAEIFELNILGGIHFGSYFFSGSLIVVTGTNLNSPYPYLTGTHNDILMCGRPYTGAILTGNIGIYDTLGAQINGLLYTGNKLYITGMDGLDFVLSGNVIIIQ